MSLINRPTAVEWQEHLTEVLENQGLARCELFPKDFRHIRFVGKPCPQCQLDALRSVRQINLKPAVTLGNNFESHKSSKPQAAVTVSTANPPSQGSEYNGVKLLLTVVLVIVVLVFLSELSGGSSSSTRSAANDRSASTATPPSVALASIPRTNSRGKDVPTLRSGINSGVIPVYPLQIQQVNSTLSTVRRNGDSGGFLSEGAIREIEDQSIWWYTSGNRLFVRLYNPSVADIANVYFELTTAECDSAQGRKFLLKFTLTNPLRGKSYAVYSGDLPFDYMGMTGTDTRCGTVVAATKPANPVRPAAGNESDASTPQVEMSIAMIQHYLRRLGFDPGPVDGILGTKTQRAIQEFQISRGLVGDGEITPRLERELKSVLGATSSSSSNGPKAVSHVSVYTTNGGGAGWSAGHSSQREADAAALRNCRQYSSDAGRCKKWFGDVGKCIAISRDSQGTLNGAWGGTEGSVVDRALKSCREGGGGGCKVVGSLCG